MKKSNVALTAVLVAAMAAPFRDGPDDAAQNRPVYQGPSRGGKTNRIKGTGWDRPAKRKARLAEKQALKKQRG